ncbi:MAG: hypothetical protein CME31_23235 [Gimesia sp.]|nr:hypothetical protein [Gimesia sp.]
MAFWDQLEGETATAFRAFCAYRDMGLDRTQRQAWEMLQRADGKQTKSMNPRWKEWRKHYRWDDRSEAFDAYQDSIFQKRLIDTNMKSRQKMIRSAQNLQEFAVQVIHKSDIEEMDSDEARKHLKTAVTALKDGIQLEMSLLGIKTEPGFTPSSSAQNGQQIDINILIDQFRTFGTRLASTDLPSVVSEQPQALNIGVDGNDQQHGRVAEDTRQVSTATTAGS